MKKVKIKYKVNYSYPQLCRLTFKHYHIVFNAERVSIDHTLFQDEKGIFLKIFKSFEIFCNENKVDVNSLYKIDYHKFYKIYYRKYLYPILKEFLE